MLFEIDGQLTIMSQRAQKRCMQRQLGESPRREIFFKVSPFCPRSKVGSYELSRCVGEQNYQEDVETIFLFRVVL